MARKKISHLLAARKAARMEKNSSGVFMPALVDVLDYWFGHETEDVAVIQTRRNLWFGKDALIDREIRRKFAALVEEAGNGPIASGGLPEPLARLAQIILLDQFTRNIYRDLPQSFAGDPVALQLCLDGLEKSEDRMLRPVERIFYYLPLEHSEDPQLQKRSVELFRQLLQDVPVHSQEAFAGYVEYAIRHQVVIDRFGRFPHRNAILGRASTPEELEFLQQPNSSF